MAVLAYLSADWHLPEEASHAAWRDLPETAGDVFVALRHVVARCVAAGVPLLAAGDLFDGPEVAPDALALAYRELRALGDNRLSLYYVLGNHDRGRDWLKPLGPRARRLGGRGVLRAKGFDLWGLDFHPPARFAEALRRAPAADVGLYHQCWSEWGRGPCAVAGLPPHRVAVCGDVHLSRVRPRGPDGQGPQLAVSPGPLAPRSVAEFNPPTAYELLDDFSVRLVELPHRRCLLLEVDSPEQAERACTTVAGLAPSPGVPDELARPLVALRLGRGAPDGFAEAARALALDRGVLLRSYRAAAPRPPQGAAGPGGVITPTAAPASRPTQAAARGSDPLSEAVALGPLKGRARELALRLVADGADPAGVVASLLAHAPQGPESGVAS